jgi:hypothetical protein
VQHGCTKNSIFVILADFTLPKPFYNLSGFILLHLYNKKLEQFYNSVVEWKHFYIAL